jgi:hypothetical protein
MSDAGYDVSDWDTPAGQTRHREFLANAQRVPVIVISAVYDETTNLTLVEVTDSYPVHHLGERSGAAEGFTFTDDDTVIRYYDCPSPTKLRFHGDVTSSARPGRRIVPTQETVDALERRKDEWRAAGLAEEDMVFVSSEGPLPPR